VLNKVIEKWKLRIRKLFSIWKIKHRQRGILFWLLFSCKLYWYKLFGVAIFTLRTAGKLYALVNGWEGKRSFTFNYLQYVVCYLGTLFIATIRSHGFQLSVPLLYKNYYAKNFYSFHQLIFKLLNLNLSDLSSPSTFDLRTKIWCFLNKSFAIYCFSLSHCYRIGIVWTKNPVFQQYY